MPLKIKLTVTQLCLSLCLLLAASVALAQPRTVTGTVTNAETNAPIAGATITVKGTSVATQSNEGGKFTITVPTNRNTLTVSFVGFQTQDLPLGNSNLVNISLKGATASLNEVVVTGYTTQRKKDITGAVAVVNVNNMKQQPVGTGEEALQGQASGVTVITSGQPGGASDLRIRGVTSFGNNQPLVIIDGTPGNLHDVNTADIESLQVLKDASASIYGVRGSNGVIIITTKRGRSGRARVSYDGYYGITEPGKGWALATPAQEAAAKWQQLRNMGLTPADTTGKWGSKQFGKGENPVLPDYLTPTGYVLCNCPADSVVNPSRYDINNYQITKANNAGTDWYHEVMRRAPMQSHNVSVSGGAEKSSYYFSLGYINQQGAMISTYLKRYSVRANTQFNIKDHIRIGENAYIYYKDNPVVSNQSESNPLNMVYREDPIIPVYDIMGNYAGTKSQDLGNAQNPVAIVKRRENNRGNDWNISGNVFAEADFLKHFTARTQFGGSVDNNYYYYFNYTAYENAEGNTNPNSFTEGSGFSSSKTWTNTLTYSNTFGSHSVKALIGTEANSYYGRYMSGTRGSYFSLNPNYWVLRTGSPTGATTTSDAYQGALWSQFAQVNYNYNDKYLISGTLRRDGSSVFDTAYRFGWFPSVSAAWRLSSEDFIKSIGFINDLKLRYSWGKLGSISNVPGGNAFNLYDSRPGRSFYDIGGTSTQPSAGFYASRIGNASTSWEGDIISNVGLDASILKNKIDFTVEWYKKKISGLLFPAQLTRMLGDADAPFINIGDMQNTGVDANVTYHGGLTNGLRFDLTGTLTTYNNKIISIPGSGYFTAGGSRHGDIVRNQTGQQVGAFYGYKVIGLFQSAEDVQKSPTQTNAGPGRFKYADINGDGKIDDNDRTIIGNPNPKFTYGLNIALSYKNFDFSTFLFGSYGNDIFNTVKQFTDFPQFFKGAMSVEAATNAWTPQNTNAKIPILETVGGFSTTDVINSYYIEKGSYLRDKQMQLGYTFPAKTLSRIGVDRLRIYVQAANLFTITKYSGLDPELQSTDPNSTTNGTSTTFGIDYANYPHLRSYLVGVNLGF